MPDYITEPITTNPEDIFQEFVEYIRAGNPDWVADEAALDVRMARWLSLKVATIADRNSRVFRSIFTYFGGTINNIQPIGATPAIVSTAWTATAPAPVDGYSIPAGTEVGIPDQFGDLQVFEVSTDYVIPAGFSGIADVILTAQNGGTDYNGLYGTCTLIEQLDWIQDIITEAASSGGNDAETTDEYINRLTSNFALMAPRPLLAKDFALLARNVPGVWRSAAIDNYLPGTNQVDKIDFTGAPTTGTWILTIDGQATSAIARNATLVAVRAAIEALANTEPEDFILTGGPAPIDINIEHTGRYRATTRTLSVTHTFDTGSVAITAVTARTLPNTVAENASAVTGVDVLGAPLLPQVKTDLDVYLTSLLQQNFLLSVLDVNPTTINVSATVLMKVGADAGDTIARSEEAIRAFLDPASWGIPSYPQDYRGFEVVRTIYAQDFYTVLNNIDSVVHVNSLSFNGGASGVFDASDKTLIGAFPIPRIGAITVTVA